MNYKKYMQDQLTHLLGIIQKGYSVEEDIENLLEELKNNTRSEIQSLNLIENYKSEIEKNLNEIREYREMIKEINKSI